jgi:predicted enzyme related to lactoylglutathione lyase
MARVIHFDVHASDPESLAAFYAKVFEWKFNHMPQFDYWLIDSGSGEGINGGMLRRRGPRASDGQPVNAFVCTLGVPTLDTYLERALGAGATLAMSKQTIPGVGYQAYIKDPDGNILGLHQADPLAK